MQAKYTRGTAALQAGRYSEAIGELRGVLQARPADLEVRYNLGVALLRLRSWREAEKVLAVAQAVPGLEVRPLGEGLSVPANADADYLHALGTSLQEQRRLRSALACFDAALARDAAHLKARYARALTLEDLGETARARTAWREYIERDPSGGWSDSARRHLQALDEQPHTRRR